MRTASMLFDRSFARSTLFAAGICATLMASAGCGAKPIARPPRAAVAVTLAPVRRMSVPYEVTADGVVTPMQTAVVVPQIDGIITDVDFSEGQNVAKGDVLFKIEPRPYQAAYDQAGATIRRDRVTAIYAKEEAARYDTLAQSRAVTKEQDDQARATWESAQATVDADQAALDKAKFDLDNTTIRAPISGRTGGLLVHIGNVVHAAGSTGLVLINQVQPTLVRFAVPGSQLAKILHYGGRGGLAVTVVDADTTRAPADTTTPMDAPPSSAGAMAPRHPHAAAVDPDHSGKLSFIDNAIDTTTAMVQLKGTFPNKGGSLWAGQFVTASLRLYVEDSALVVPTGAVVSGQTGTYVWVVDSSNAAQERPVVVERAAGDLSVITSGVSDGERVVTSGQSRLTSGAPVTLGDSTGGGAGRRGGRGGRGGGRGARGGGKGNGQGASTP